jgi:UDPglucose 6-dehydrogenase
VAAPVIVTDTASAETIKYAANAFLATKLSYINAIASICEGVGADINHVVAGIGSDKRIGSDFLRPGPGWGGSCFPKDTKALLAIAHDAGYSFDLLAGVIAVNQEQFARVTAKILGAAGPDPQGATVAVWGLTFKALTDDLRDSPSIGIIERLLAAGCRVRAYDPTVSGPKPGLPPQIEVCTDPYAACEGADVLTVLTEWDEFRWLEAERAGALMVRRQVVDARNLLDRRQWIQAGFTHQGIGR